jgi:hypothetical protein
MINCTPDPPGFQVQVTENANSTSAERNLKFKNGARVDPARDHEHAKGEKKTRRTLALAMEARQSARTTVNLKEKI